MEPWAINVQRLAVPLAVHRARFGCLHRGYYDISGGLWRRSVGWAGVRLEVDYRGGTGRHALTGTGGPRELSFLAALMSVLGNG